MAPPRTGSDAALIARAVLRLGRRLRAARPEAGLTLSSVGLLATLHARGPMPAVALARAERLRPQSLSRLIARLEQDGHIARTRGTGDRRTVPISITAAGRRALRRDMAARRAWLERAMSATLTRQERALLGASAALMLRLAAEGASRAAGGRSATGGSRRAPGAPSDP